MLAAALAAGVAAGARADTVGANAAADGVFHDFATSSGSAHYALLTPNCSAATYTYSSTSGAADSYRLSIYAVPPGATITGIEIRPCAAGYDGTSGVLQAFYVLNGGANASAGQYSLPAGAPAWQAPTTFGGLSILRTQNTALEAGVRLTSGAVKLSGLTVRITYTPPPPFLAPTGLTAVGVSASEIELSWTDNTTNESGFRIERSLNGTTSWALVRNVASNATRYRDSGLSADQNYYYRLQASNLATGQSSAFTPAVNAITYASVPATPRNLWLAPSGPGAALSWMRLSNNDDGTAIERSSDGVSFSEIGRTAAGASTFSDASGAAGARYRVRAFNKIGLSAYSNTASDAAASTQGPDLRVSLAARGTSRPGSQTTFFDVTYRNAGTARAENAQLSAIVPANTTFDYQSSSPEWQCLDPGADAFFLRQNIAAALRAFKHHFPNLQQAFVSSHNYTGFTSTAGTVEPYGFETGYAVKDLIEAQIRQARSGTVDALAGDLDYRTGTAPWTAWGPYFWANGTTPNGQGLFFVPEDFGSDLVHPGPIGRIKLGNYLLNYLLSAPYTGWIRVQPAPPIPIVAPPQPLPSPPALIDIPPGQKYLGLSGRLYPDESNLPPDDHHAAGMDAAARIVPLDAGGIPSATGKILFLGIGYSNTVQIFNGFMTLAAADPRIKVQSRGGRDTARALHILNGAIGGANAQVWADATHAVYDQVKSLLTGWGYSPNQVQAIWYHTSNGGLARPGIKPSLSGSAAGTLCQLPLRALDAGAFGGATFAVRTTFGTPRTITFGVSAFDDGTAGTDMAPGDNATQASFTVVP